MLDIIVVPDKRLRQISQDVRNIDKKFLSFLDDLKSTLKEKTNPPGVGISGVQVGKLSRVFVTYLPKTAGLPTRFWNDKTLELVSYINPEIIKKSKKKTLGGRTRSKPFLEGCLSIPNIYGPVWRHEWVEISYKTQVTCNKIEEKRKKFSGFAARVIQHEMDHLNGILFTDYSLRDKLPVYEEANDKLVEIEL